MNIEEPRAADGTNPRCQSWLLGIVMLKNAPQHTQRCHSYVQSEWETLTECCPHVQMHVGRIIAFH